MLRLIFRSKNKISYKSKFKLQRSILAIFIVFLMINLMTNSVSAAQSIPQYRGDNELNPISNLISSDSNREGIPDAEDLFFNNTFLPVDIILWILVSFIIVSLITILGTTLVLKRKEVTTSEEKLKTATKIKDIRQRVLGVKGIKEFIQKQSLDRIIIVSKIFAFINCFIPAVLYMPTISVIFAFLVNVMFIAVLKKKHIRFLRILPIWILLSTGVTLIFFNVFAPVEFFSEEWFEITYRLVENPYMGFVYILMITGPTPATFVYLFTIGLIDRIPMFTHELIIGGLRTRIYVILASSVTLALLIFWIIATSISIKNALKVLPVKEETEEQILLKILKFLKFKATRFKMDRSKIGVLFLVLLIIAMPILSIMIYYRPPATAPSPEVLWTFNTNDCVYSSPALADLDGDGDIDVIFGSLDNKIYALDGESGTLLWDYRTFGSIGSSPALADLDNDGKIEIVITSEDKNVYVLNGENGSLLWKFHTNNRIFSSPTIGDINGDSKLDVVIGSTDEHIYAINGENGSLLWSFTTNESIFTSPALGDVDCDGKLEVIFGSDDRKIYALNGEDGSLLWSSKVNGPVRVFPILGDIDNDGKLEVITGIWNNTVYALNGEDGTILWTFETRDVLQTSPALGDINSDGKLEVIIGDWGQKVYALNGNDGSILWKTDLGGGISSTPAIGDINGDNKLDIVIQTEFEHLYALNGEDGKILWHYNTGGGVTASPTLGDLDNDNRIEIIVGTFRRRVYAFNFPDDQNSGFRIYWARSDGDLFNTRNVLAFDQDQDCLSNYTESIAGTDPTLKDSDSDNLPDYWEVIYNLNPLDATDASQDTDNDGLSNLEEYQHGSDPVASDTDMDFVPDVLDIQPCSSFLPIMPITIFSTVALAGVLYTKWIKKEQLFYEVILKIHHAPSLDSIVTLLKFIMIVNGFLSINPWLPVFSLVFILNISLFIGLVPEKLKDFRTYRILIITGTIASILFILKIHNILYLGSIISLLYLVSFIGPSLGFLTYYVFVMLSDIIGIADWLFEEYYMLSVYLIVTLITVSNLILFQLTRIADNQLRKMKKST